MLRNFWNVYSDSKYKIQKFVNVQILKPLSITAVLLQGWL